MCSPAGVMLEILREPPSASRSNQLGTDDWPRSGVPEVDLKILVHELEAATRLKREDLLHSGIHDDFDLEHGPVFGTDWRQSGLGLAKRTFRPIFKTSVELLPSTLSRPQ